MRPTRADLVLWVWDDPEPAASELVDAICGRNGGGAQRDNRAARLFEPTPCRAPRRSGGDPPRF